jgi:hypothetical protein
LEFKYRFYRHQNGRFQKMPHDYFIFEIMKVLHPILYSSWPSAVCHQQSFANVSFMAMNLMVLDDEHGCFPIFWA